ncbi:MAG: hypothetical protein HQK86_03310 [Nitrospinae bacterium]|nr:hypothetical protein [Nitrospinota bacterium]
MIRALALAALLLWPVMALADQLAVEPNSAPIGTNIRLTLTVELGKGEKALPPSGIKLPKGAELVTVHPPKTAPKENGGQTLSQTYEIAMWEVGKTSIPEIEYTVVSADGKEEKRHAGPVELDIKSVRTDPATADKPKDIKPPVDVELRWGDYAWAALAALALAIAAYFLYRRWKNRPQKPVSAPLTPPAPARPPYDVALEKLETLKRDDLFGAGRGRDFFFRLSDILREYVEGRYGLLALERTTAELEREFGPSYAPDHARNAFLSMLRACDMVKFAKVEPVKLQADEALEKALMFVESTRPAPPIPTADAK